MGTGTTFKEISGSRAAEIPIPLPPLAEQHRIVAEIEKQLTRLDAAVAALERARANLKRYRASVLKAAVEGRLVLGPDARSAKEERSLPVGWSWVTLGDLATVGTGATPLRSNPAYYGGSIPWVTSGALNRPFVDEAEEFITSKALRETNAKVFPAGTLLVAMYGEGKTRGKTSELRIDAATNQACAALVFHTETMPARPYVKLFLAKHYEDLRLESSGGVQPNLNLSIMKAIRVPMPPADLRDQIVAEVERRISVIETLETTVDHSLKRAERLRQSVLKRAFEGHLVPQDANDEPASVLLERIRAERAKIQPVRRIRRTKAGTQMALREVST
jgi:type I restriction enzyme S subunit